MCKGNFDSGVTNMCIDYYICRGFVSETTEGQIASCYLLSSLNMFFIKLVRVCLKKKKNVFQNQIINCHISQLFLYFFLCNQSDGQL